MFTASIQVVAEYQIRQIFQQVFAAEEFVAGRAEVFENFFLAFVFFLGGW